RAGHDVFPTLPPWCREAVERGERDLGDADPGVNDHGCVEAAGEATRAAAARRSIIARWASRYSGSSSQSWPQVAPGAAGSAMTQTARRAARAGMARRSAGESKRTRS